MIETKSRSNHNQNDVQVNNQITITVNFGDSLNLLALIAGLYMLRKIAKRPKN